MFTQNLGLTHFLLVWSEIKLNSYSQENLYQIGDFAQTLLPVAAVFWPIFVFHQYVEGNTREVIFCYRRGHLFELLAYGLLYIVFMAIPFIVLSCYYQNVGWEYLRVIVQSVFFISLSYAAIFLMRSAALSLLLSLLLEMIFILMRNYVSSQWSVFSFDCLAKGDVFSLSEGEQVDKYAVLLTCSVLFWAIGYWRARRIKV